MVKKPIGVWLAVIYTGLAIVVQMYGLIAALRGGLLSTTVNRPVVFVCISLFLFSIQFAAAGFLFALRKYALPLYGLYLAYLCVRSIHAVLYALHQPGLPAAMYLALLVPVILPAIIFAYCVKQKRAAVLN